VPFLPPKGKDPEKMRKLAEALMAMSGFYLKGFKTIGSGEFRGLTNRDGTKGMLQDQLESGIVVGDEIATGNLGGSDLTRDIIKQFRKIMRSRKIPPPGKS
tara:strand:- start:3244 stop:3546 length:303 start_codon:yes stop_codon:yes gene_type:complete